MKKSQSPNYQNTKAPAHCQAARKENTPSVENGGMARQEKDNPPIPGFEFKQNLYHESVYAPNPSVEEGMIPSMETEEDFRMEEERAQMIAEMETVHWENVDGGSKFLILLRRFLLLPAVSMGVSLLLCLLNRPELLTGTAYRVICDLCMIGLVILAYCETRTFRHMIDRRGKRFLYNLLSLVIFVGINVVIWRYGNELLQKLITVVIGGSRERYGVNFDSEVKYMTVFHAAIALITLLELRITDLMHRIGIF